MNADLQSPVVILVAAALAPLLGFAEAEGVVKFLSTVGLAFPSA
ncbi:MAG: hypothetical protein ACRDMW_05190 [Gaiellaceae bacterium]